jgi:ParB family chromosome partitioning protein
MVRQIDIDNLVPFPNHPFKLYVGKRLDDMVESVKANGIITPIIVRLKGSDYEILSGHNRVEAARIAKLRKVPAVVREGLTDDTALLIVTLSNLQQRGFSELSYSERAEVIRLTHASLKHQGQRTDLLDEVDEMLGGKKLLSDIRKKLTPRDALAEQFGLTSGNIAYYLRLSKLIQPLIELLDDGKIDLSVSEKLTYLKEEQQQIVSETAAKFNVKITIGKAKALVNASKREPLTEDAVREILTEKRIRKSSYRLNLDVYEMFFADTEQEQIDDIIFQALSKWKESLE